MPPVRRATVTGPSEVVPTRSPSSTRPTRPRLTEDWRGGVEVPEADGGRKVGARTNGWATGVPCWGCRTDACGIPAAAIESPTAQATTGEWSLGLLDGGGVRFERDDSEAMAGSRAGGIEGGVGAIHATRHSLRRQNARACSSARGAENALCSEDLNPDVSRSHSSQMTRKVPAGVLEARHGTCEPAGCVGHLRCPGID